MDQTAATSFEKKPKVYLDWAATAPLYTEAYEAMLPYLVPGRDNIITGANANSLHSYGRSAFSALEEARRSLAYDLGISRPSEIVFTSSATEANNMAVFGIVEAQWKNMTQKSAAFSVPHIITSTIEHDAILAPFKALGAKGAEVTYLTPDKNGFIDPEKLRNALKMNTVFVSIQYANSEIGSLQNIGELCSIAHENGVYFHTDAVQAFGKLTIDINSLGVDAASFSAHKVGGPKGVGALYLKHKTPFVPLLLGGGQEMGKRSGTQNVCGVVGFAAASKISNELLSFEQKRLTELRDYLYGTLGSYANATPSVDSSVRKGAFLPNIVNVLVEGFESETLILRLDALGYEVSGGSACSSKSLDPSHVLTALGYSKDEAYGSLRISMGRYTTKEDIDGFLEAFIASTSEDRNRWN